MRGVSPHFLDVCGFEIVRFFKSSVYAGGVAGGVASFLDVCGVDIGFVSILDLCGGCRLILSMSAVLKSNFGSRFSENFPGPFRASFLLRSLLKHCH